MGNGDFRPFIEPNPLRTEVSTDVIDYYIEVNENGKFARLLRLV
jgi:hypothetical protein